MNYISGARVDSIVSPIARIKAENLYREFRNRSYDFEIVSANTKMSIEYTQMIKNYLFRDFHVQVDGEQRFLPSYDIAQSWRRLSTKDNVKIYKHDYLLLYHELYEISLLIQYQDWIQVDAHEAANLKYNYQAAADQFYLSQGIKVR